MPLSSTLANRGEGRCPLSLDAGGSRGISQLKILTHLMYRLNVDSSNNDFDRPCAVFDMIGGTGTGGFIAILLVLFGLTAEQASEEFMELVMNVLDIKAADAESRTAVLKDYIEKLMDKHDLKKDIDIMCPNGRSKNCKLIVPISYKQNVGPICMIRNFSVRQEPPLNMTVKDALLATLATPPLFSPTSVFKDAATFEYVGADLALSNPSRQIIKEAHGAFGSGGLVSCFLSLGCGHPGVIDIPDASESATWSQFIGKLAGDSEQKAQEIESQMGIFGIYHRFSVTRGLEKTMSINGPSPGSVLAHTEVYLDQVSVSRNMDLCVDIIKARDGSVPLEQLAYSGAQTSLPPSIPPLTRTFVMRKKPWDFIERAVLGAGEEEQEQDGPRMLAVTGIGGCGKTQIIVKFLRVHARHFASRFFIDGSSIARIRVDIIRHVRALGPEHSQKSFIDCLLFLAQPSPTGPRLLFYDNVDDPEIELSPLLPDGDNCVVIITSRNRSVGELCPDSHLELDVMSMDEAVELLLHTPGSSVESTQQDRQEACSIAQVLGCLPIALTQARSYMSQTKCSWSVYLEILTSSRDEQLARPVKNHRDMRYLSTYAAFDASFRILALRDQRLLQLLSYFHWSNFPLSLVILAAKHQFTEYQSKYVEHDQEYYTGKKMLEDIFHNNGRWIVTELNDMMVSLQNYSLITLVPGVETTLLQMHPLVRSWVQSGISDKDRAKYQSAAVLMLALGARSDPTPMTQYLANHVTHLSHTWDELNVNNAAAFGTILSQCGLFEGALGLQKKVVTQLRSLERSGGISLPSSLCSLAATYHGLGKYKEQATALVEASRLEKTVLGEHHPDTLKASRDLAGAYHNLGRLGDAEKLGSDVVRLSGETLGEQHPDTVSASNSLACTYRALGRLNEAEAVQLKVLKLAKEMLGPRHPKTIAASSDLAVVYHDLRRLDEAKVLREEILRLREEIFGERHPDTVSASSNLASTYRELGQMDEAERLQVKVLMLRKEILGERHPNTITASHNLARTYYGMGRLKEAERLQEEVLKTRTQVLGDRHRFTVDTMISLAITYDKLLRKPEALDLLTRAEVILSETLGKDHPRYQHCQHVRSAVQLGFDGFQSQRWSQIDHEYCN